MKKASIMMEFKETVRTWFTSLQHALPRPVPFVLCAAIVIGNGFAMTVMAQEDETPKSAKKRSVSAGRDPFRKYEPGGLGKRGTERSPIPSIHERISHYKALKAAAMSARLPAPKPTTALLLSEIQVVGISRSPRGYAAIVEAVPIKLSYVVYPGEAFYDGQLVAIEDNRLVFRRETVFIDGRRERSVEFKSLRQPTPVNAMTTPDAVATAKPE